MREGMTEDHRFRDRRRLMQLTGGALLAGVPVTTVLANSAALVGFRLVHQDNVMLHFDLVGPAEEASLFALEKPQRLVIDFSNTALQTALPDRIFEQGAVQSVRSGSQADGRLRIVVDLRQPVSATYQFVARGDGRRLVVDLGVPGNAELATHSQRQREPESRPAAGGRDVIIAIDAGHGGKDPGAIGQRGTREKDIVLPVARRLQARLASTPGIKPVMIRDRDVFVALRERLRLARTMKADLFISIHADAFKRKSAHGSSVYALSLKGATSEAAKWLAEKQTENAALFGDVALDGLSDTLKSTLLDLAQNATLEASLDMGGEVLKQLKRIGPVHKKSVEQAPFAVLKSPDIPSLLVETAFISNLQEERKLKSPQFQEELAQAVHNGVVNYLKRRAPQGSFYDSLANQKG